MKAITSEWDLAEELQINPSRFTYDQLSEIGRIMGNNATIIRKYEEIIENYKRIMAVYENKLAMKVDCPHKEQCPAFWGKMEKE